MAKAAPGDYAGSIQEAVKNGASPDQALRYATADVAMEVIAERVPMDELLGSAAGNPKRAAGIMDAVLKQYGIRMTGEELGWLGGVAAEASRLQQHPAFTKVTALEMLKGLNSEQARTAASRVVWQQTLDWAMTSKAFEATFSLDENAIDGREALDNNALENPGETEMLLDGVQDIPEAYGQQEAIAMEEAGTENVGEKRFQDLLEKAQKGDIIESEEQVEPQNTYKIFQTGEEVNDFFYYDGEERNLEALNAAKQKQWESSLTERESKAVKDYTGIGHYEINAFLRGTGDWESINMEYVQQQIEKLDSAIERFELKDNIRVQRGVMEDALDSLILQYGDDSTQFIGKVFHDDGFASTTVLEGNRVATAKPVIFEIDVPAGVGRGAYVNRLAGTFQDTEYEFLLKRGADYTITEVFIDSDTEKLIIRMVMNDG